VSEYGFVRQRGDSEGRTPGKGVRLLLRRRLLCDCTKLGTGQWRDYLGESVYNDYTVDATSGYVTPGTAYAPGIGFDDPALADMPAYVGADQIGTTRRVTDRAAAGAQVIERTVYTAFGERLNLTDGSGAPAPSPVTRYGYAGAWGYEEATCEPPGAPAGWCDPLTNLGWLHVGERYYDPAIGRFMQRDPIGIRGGFNVYEYVESSPSDSIDDQGLKTRIVNDRIQTKTGVRINYYRIRSIPVFGDISCTYIRSRFIPKNGTPTKGLPTTNGEADVDELITRKNKADADFIGIGQEEINKHKEVTQDYLKGAKKVIPKLPR